MELIIKVVLIVIVVALVVAWVRRQWEKLLAWLSSHRMAIIGVGVAAVTIAVAWFTTLSHVASPPVNTQPGPGPTPVELPPTVESPWSATSTGLRASTGIALTTAAAEGK